MFLMFTQVFLHVSFPNTNDLPIVGQFDGGGSEDLGVEEILPVVPWLLEALLQSHILGLMLSSLTLDSWKTAARKMRVVWVSFKSVLNFFKWFGDAVKCFMLVYNHKNSKWPLKHLEGVQDLPFDLAIILFDIFIIFQFSFEMCAAEPALSPVCPRGR